MAVDLMTRAQAGDDEAFRALTEPHRRELLAHCYRMLGSFQDAEDALQDTMLTAWRGIGRFERRSSLRTWLYRVATNVCLNVRRAASRRPPAAWNVPGMAPPEPTQIGEVVWLEPFPDALMDDLERRETMSLAFITALQLLPPRQMAVLVLRDVLEFSAAEVAEMLDMSLDAANSALKRARAGLSSRYTPPAEVPDEEALASRFVDAYESGDIAAIVALLKDDVFMSMPPIPLEYIGPEPVAEFLSLLFGAGRRHSLVPTRANGQPAFGAYLRGADGVRHATGLHVIGLSGDRIASMTRFESHHLERFGLPRTLPATAYRESS